MKNLFIALCSLAVIGFGCKNLSGGDSDNSPKSSENTFNPALLGAWSDTGYPVASCVVREDSIYYTDLGKSFRYHSTGDSMTIYFDDSVFKGSFRINQDTLFCTHNGATNTLLRAKMPDNLP